MQEDYVQGLRPSNSGFIDSFNFRTSHFYSKFERAIIYSQLEQYQTLWDFKVEFGAMPGHSRFGHTASRLYCDGNSKMRLQGDNQKFLFRTVSFSYTRRNKIRCTDFFRNKNLAGFRGLNISSGAVLSVSQHIR